MAEPKPDPLIRYAKALGAAEAALDSIRAHCCPLPMQVGANDTLGLMLMLRRQQRIAQLVERARADIAKFTETPK